MRTSRQPWNQTSLAKEKTTREPGGVMGGLGHGWLWLVSFRLDKEYFRSLNFTLVERDLTSTIPGSKWFFFFRLLSPAVYWQSFLTSSALMFPNGPAGISDCNHARVFKQRRTLRHSFKQSPQKCDISFLFFLYRHHQFSSEGHFKSSTNKEAGDDGLHSDFAEETRLIM